MCSTITCSNRLSSTIGSNRELDQLNMTSQVLNRTRKTTKEYRIWWRRDRPGPPYHMTYTCLAVSTQIEKEFLMVRMKSLKEDYEIGKSVASDPVTREVYSSSSPLIHSLIIMYLHLQAINVLIIFFLILQFFKTFLSYTMSNKTDFLYDKIIRLNCQNIFTFPKNMYIWLYLAYIFPFNNLFLIHVRSIFKSDS